MIFIIIIKHIEKLKCALSTRKGHQVAIRQL